MLPDIVRVCLFSKEKILSMFLTLLCTGFVFYFAIIKEVIDAKFNSGRYKLIPNKTLLQLSPETKTRLVHNEIEKNVYNYNRGKKFKFRAVTTTTFTPLSVISHTPSHRSLVSSTQIKPPHLRIKEKYFGIKRENVLKVTRRLPLRKLTSMRTCINCNTNQSTKNSTDYSLQTLQSPTPNTTCIDCETGYYLPNVNHSMQLPIKSVFELLQKLVYDVGSRDEKGNGDDVNDVNEVEDVEAKLKSRHEQEWDLVNNQSTCQDWRFEPQNWTAFVTGKLRIEHSNICSNPYKDNNVKRIIFSNLTEELTGCTKYTDRCLEGADFDYRLNIRINMPPCCLRHLLEMYRHVEYELTQLNVTHFMVGGGIIGWARNKRMIPYDDDLDILIPMKAWKGKKFWKFVGLMRKKYKHPCRLVEPTKMKIYYSKTNSINMDMWPYKIFQRRVQKHGHHKNIFKRRIQKASEKRASQIRRRFSSDNDLNANDVYTAKFRKKLSYFLRQEKLPRSPSKRSKNVFRFIDIPYKNFKIQPVENLLPPKQVVFENFLVYIPANHLKYLDVQYGKGKWRKEYTCQDKDLDGSCTE